MAKILAERGRDFNPQTSFPLGEQDRRDRESAKAYSHFCLYRDMGVTRSLRQVADIPGCTSGRPQLNRWSSKWRWVQRSQKYDDYLERDRRLQKEKDQRAMHERHTNVALLGMNVAVKGLEGLLNQVQAGERKLEAGELARLFDTCAKLERTARAETLASGELKDLTPGNRMGRPRSYIDWTVVDALCAVQATGEEIAAALDLSVDTLERATKREHERTFAEYFAQKRKPGLLSLRRKQFQTAMCGDRTMLVWLGKQWLGQQDRQEVTLGNDPLQGLLDEFRKEHEFMVKENQARGQAAAPEQA